jgi:hypothetical protein
MSNGQIEPDPAQDERQAFEHWHAAQEAGLAPEGVRAIHLVKEIYWQGWQARAARPAQTEQQPVAWKVFNPRTKKVRFYSATKAYLMEGFRNVGYETTPLYAAPIAQTAPQQTEQQPAYVECRECADCGHVGINDAHQTDATCAMCYWSGPSPVEDQCPDCGKENVMGAACPKCSGRYRILAETHVAAPIAQTAPQLGDRLQRGLTEWRERA